MSKYENLLSLALDATEDEREKSINLGVGYNEMNNTWEVIIKYDVTRSNGNANGVTEQIRAVTTLFTPLSYGYGIAIVNERQLASLAAIPYVTYIEKPKNLYYEITEGISASCINEVQAGSLNLYGSGTIVAVIDSGIDYLHPAFVDASGNTRIIELWDQNNNTIYSREDINRALYAYREEGIAAAYRIVNFTDESGHGTHVAGICAGNFATDKNRDVGIATRADIIAVKLGIPNQNAFPAYSGFPKTTELMRAVDYVVNKGIELNRPTSVNISFGNTYGSHDGESLLETYIDEMASSGRTCISIGSGNEGATAGHNSGYVVEGKWTDIELAVGQYETKLNVQLWKLFYDDMTIEIISPSGDSTGGLNGLVGTHRFRFASNEILIYFGEPSPYSTYQEIYADFITMGNAGAGNLGEYMGEGYIESGIWKIRLYGREIVDGRYDMWLPVEGTLGNTTFFLEPDPMVTLTIPSTSRRAITVGAYNAYDNTYANFSGRGYTRFTNLIKPDIVAPGVDILSASPGGGLTARTGTSMATPFVTGSAALLMEWGIVRGNDPYLYGEKVKAYLINGARRLSVANRLNIYPNPMLGWGALCVRDSLPI